jgi:hypothetical protein
VLPATYHHLVFTLPDTLNGWVQIHPKEVYDLLFETVWGTLAAFGADPKRLDGQLGMTAMLHTWGQTWIAPCPPELSGAAMVGSRWWGHTMVGSHDGGITMVGSHDAMVGSGLDLCLWHKSRPDPIFPSSHPIFRHLPQVKT